MPETDLELLIRAARTAGDIALNYSRDALDVVHKSGGAGPVTKADLAVDAHLQDMLRNARPTFGWLSEESTDNPDRLSAERVFVIDPIDGTRSYIAGEKTWSHSLAIVERGVVTEAVVFLPAMGRLYAARRGAGATCNGNPIRASVTRDLAAARILTTRPNLDPRHWKTEVPAFKRGHRPSLAYRLGLVADGSFDAMFTFRPSWEWDIAAGALLVEEAGGITSDRSGKPLRFNNPHPQTDGMIGADPALHRQILERLAYADA